LPLFFTVYFRSGPLFSFKKRSFLLGSGLLFVGFPYLAGQMLLGRAAEESLISGCGPGTRATCSAVLSGALEAHPPLGLLSTRVNLQFL
jgi:hypothetical protein